MDKENAAYSYSAVIQPEKGEKNLMGAAMGMNPEDIMLSQMGVTG